MSALQLIEIVVCAAIAVYVTWLSWRTPMALVGLVLILCCIITDAAYFSYDFGVRVIFEVVQAGLLCNAARIVFVSGAGTPAIVVAVLAIIDLAVCAVQPIIPPDAMNKGFWFGTATNLAFLLAAACVAYPGARDAYRARRVRSGRHGLVGGPRSSLNAGSSKR